jgi:hypothetical protein
LLISLLLDLFDSRQVECIDEFKLCLRVQVKKMKKSPKRSKGWGGARPNTGPKPVDGTGYESHLPAIRCTLEQLEGWRADARKSGMTFSDWVRSKLSS